MFISFRASSGFKCLWEDRRCISVAEQPGCETRIYRDCSTPTSTRRRGSAHQDTKMVNGVKRGLPVHNKQLFAQALQRSWSMSPLSSVCRTNSDSLDARRRDIQEITQDEMVTSRMSTHHPTALLPCTIHRESPTSSERTPPRTPWLSAMTLCIAKLGHDEPNPMHSIPCNKQLPAMPIPPTMPIPPRACNSCESILHFLWEVWKIFNRKQGVHGAFRDTRDTRPELYEDAALTIPWIPNLTNGNWFSYSGTADNNGQGEVPFNVANGSENSFINGINSGFTSIGNSTLISNRRWVAQFDENGKKLKGTAIPSTGNVGNL